MPNTTLEGTLADARVPQLSRSRTAKLNDHENKTNIMKIQILGFMSVCALSLLSVGCASAGSPSGTSARETPSLEAGATPTDAAWGTDCGALVQALTDLIPKTSDDISGAVADQFKNKAVAWKLNFKGIAKDKRGKDESLLFDLESFGIRQKFFSGKPIMVGFKPAGRTWDSWKTIAPGSQVSITAVLKSVFFATLTPGDNPGMHVRVAFVSVENVKLVQD